jgi:hypothetical protein
MSHPEQGGGAPDRVFLGPGDDADNLLKTF